MELRAALLAACSILKHFEKTRDDVGIVPYNFPENFEMICRGGRPSARSIGKPPYPKIGYGGFAQLNEKRIVAGAGFPGPHKIEKRFRKIIRPAG